MKTAALSAYEKKPNTCPLTSFLMAVVCAGLWLNNGWIVVFWAFSYHLFYKSQRFDLRLKYHINFTFFKMLFPRSCSSLLAPDTPSGILRPAEAGTKIPFRVPVGPSEKTKSLFSSRQKPQQVAVTFCVLSGLADG